MYKNITKVQFTGGYNDLLMERISKENQHLIQDFLEKLEPASENDKMHQIYEPDNSGMFLLFSQIFLWFVFSFIFILSHLLRFSFPYLFISPLFSILTLPFIYIK